jgi:hypothetical protein
MSVEVLGNNLIEVTVEPTPIVEISVESTPVVEVEVYPGGVVNTGSVDLSNRYQLILNRFTSNPQLHKEYTYTGENLTRIEAWNSSAKTTKYYTINFTYTGANLTGKTLTDNVNGDVLNVVYSYIGSNLTSVSETFS